MDGWKVKSDCFLERFLSVFPYIEIQYKKAQFAKILGVERAAIGRWVNGEEPKGEKLKHAIYRFLEKEHVTLEGQRWIMDNFEERPTKMFRDLETKDNAAGGSSL